MTSRLFTACATLAVLAAPARADVELGMDFGFTRTSFDQIGSFSIDQDLNRFELPVPEFRAGFLVSDVISIEPRTTLQVLSFGFSAIARTGR